jgi:hypothetical protein
LRCSILHHSRQIFKDFEKEARNVLHGYTGDAAGAALEPVGRSPNGKKPLYFVGHVDEFDNDLLVFTRN